MVNEDGFHVHLGCGGVTETLGIREPTCSGRLEGEDLRAACPWYGAPGSEANWLAEQRRLLTALPGDPSKIHPDVRKGNRENGRAMVLAALSQAEAAATETASQLPSAVIRDHDAASAAGKRRKGFDGGAEEVPVDEARDGQMQTSAD